MVDWGRGNNVLYLKKNGSLKLWGSEMSGDYRGIEYKYQSITMK